MSRIALIFGCLAIAGCAVAHARRSGHVQRRSASQPSFAANRREARAFAERELSAVWLPAGATRTATDASAGILATPQSRPGLGKLIDRHRFWRLPGTPAALIGWLKDHRPAGTRLSGWGSAGRYGVSYAWTRDYSYRTVPQGIYDTELDFAIASARGGGTAVRVDSFAAPLIPRPAWERVPPTVTQIAITAVPIERRRSYPVATVTDAARVHRLVALFNRFQIAQPGAFFSCPALIGAAPELRFRFKSSTGTDLARATETGCVGLTFAVGGRSGPALSPDVDLQHLLWSEHVLSVCPGASVSVSAAPPTRTGPPVRKGEPVVYTLPLQIHDTSSRACGLRGYPENVRLLNAKGASPASRTARNPAGPPVTPPPTLLDQTWPAPTSLSWEAGRPGCQATRYDRVQLRLPGIPTPFTVRLRHPIAPCRGRITVAPI